MANPSRRRMVRCLPARSTVRLRRPDTPEMAARWSPSGKVPLLIVSGDEDDNCLEPGIFIKRTCMSATLLVVPATGHAVNLEEPDFFNRALLDFLTLVDTKAWRPRDPRSLGKSTLSNKG